jgi:hypothetical protein
MRLALLTFVICLTLLLPTHARADNFVTLQTIDDGDPLTNDLGRANTNINAVPIKRKSLTTVGNYQFTSYYHEDGKIVIGRRATGAATWDLFKTQFTSVNINDDHNVSSIAVDGDGVLHMSWGVHGNNLLYTKSTASVVNNTPINLVGGAVGNGSAINNMTGLYNTGVTYPDFYSLPDGDLLFAYRNGGSGSGDYRLRRYDTATDAWSELGAGPDRIWLGRKAPGSTLPDVSGYPNELAFDAQGNIQATWTWRTGGDTTTGQPGFQTNHHIMYARSANQGATWTNQAGVAYTGPIYETNAQIAINLPEGSSLINTSGMAIDGLGQPVLASWWAPGAPQNNHARQYMLAWYDNSQQQWRSSQISNRTIDGPAKTTEAVVRDMGRPLVVVDDANRVIVAYRDNQDSNGLTVAYSLSPQRNDWQSVNLTTQDLGNWEPTYDVNRWTNDRVLSFLYQPSGLNQTGAPISVLEWDSQAFFADLLAPKLKLVVDRGTGLMSLRNRTGAAVNLDGYSISSATGSLNAGQWTSLTDQLGGVWQEANVSATRLSELNPSGAFPMADGGRISLGSAFAPSGSSIGQASAGSDLAFEYTADGVETRNGAVAYVGHNNLVLRINPLTGETRVTNSSQFNVAIDGYTITSPSGSLSPAAGQWNSLDDQNAHGGQWFESNVDESRVSELLAAGAAPLPRGAEFSLGVLFDEQTGVDDLDFQFLLAGDANPLTGDVVIQIPGDFDFNGAVDAADLLIWRGAAGIDAEGDADGDGDTDGADFLAWQSHLGATWSATGAAVTVPEPASLTLACSLAAALTSSLRRRGASSLLTA